MNKIMCAALATLSLAGSAFAADKPNFYDIDVGMRSAFVTSVLDPAIHIVWDERDLPEYVDRSDPDDFSGGSKFQGYRESLAVPTMEAKCQQALGATVEIMQKEARKQGYDYILVRSQGVPKGDTKRFVCNEGYVTNDVRLIAEFVVSKPFAAKLASAPPPAAPAPRKPGEEVEKYSISSALDTPEAKAVLGSKVQLHWGDRGAPAYVRRYGPHDFDGRVALRPDVEKSCKEAFVAALKDMREEATDGKYNAVIRIRSNLDDQRAPDDSLFECRTSHRDASVSLSGTLVVLK